MDNKKLLNFLLKDLTELDELFAEKKTGEFDALEMEFLQSRIAGSKKLVQILAEREAEVPQIPVKQDVADAAPVAVKARVAPPEDDTQNLEVPDDETPEMQAPEAARASIKETVQHDKETTVAAAETETHSAGIEAEDHDAAGADDYPDEITPDVPTTQKEMPEAVVETDEMELEDEDPAENPNKRLSDVFLKEKSVNDTVDGGSGKLEHKLSNRPVASIQAAIGINDRFQYIRELFDGKPDEFTKTVTALDSKNNIKEAVSYLQQNFKWKKNETSLKFVNLVKRRFTHD